MAQNRKIKVLTTSQQIIELEVPSDISIGELKQILLQKTSIPLERQRLFYMGKAIPIQIKLSDIIKQDGQTIHLMPMMENLPQQPPSQQQLAQNPRIPQLGFSNVFVQSVGNNPEQTQNIFGQQNQIPVQQQQDAQLINIFGLPPNIHQQQRNSDRFEIQQSIFQLQPNQPNIFRQQPGQFQNIFEQQNQRQQNNQQPQNSRIQQHVPSMNDLFGGLQPIPILIPQRNRPTQYLNQILQQNVPQQNNREHEMREQFRSSQQQINQFNRVLDQMLHTNGVFPGPPLPQHHTSQITMIGDLLNEVAFQFQRSIPIIQRTADLLSREQFQLTPDQRMQTQQMARQTANLLRQMTNLQNIQELLSNVELGQRPGQSTFRNL